MYHLDVISNKEGVRRYFWIIFPNRISNLNSENAIQTHLEKEFREPETHK